LHKVVPDVGAVGVNYMAQVVCCHGIHSETSAWTQGRHKGAMS
jgi:hypothetical protein